MAKNESTLKRYQQLQALLNQCYMLSGNEFNLDEMSGDFVVLDSEGNDLFIKYLPLEGDYVYVSDFEGENRHKVPFEFFSSDVAEQILRCMTKGFITNEIKAHL